MLTFSEIVDRAYNGPLCEEKEFNLHKYATEVRKIVQKYDIEYDPQKPVPDDDDLADRVFEAGLELFSEVGTYCTNTGRIMEFTEDEIREALKDAPANPVFGEGKDAKELVAREPESDVPPWCFIGAGGTAVSSENILLSLVQAYASISRADSITVPSLTKIDGKRLRAGSPLEIFSCIRSVGLAREALGRAQRPGMPTMNNISTAASDVGKIAGGSFGVRPSDGMMIGAMAPMQINFERLNEVAYVLSRGGNIIVDTSPLVGGYSGGPEGTAVASVAYHVMAILVNRGSCQLNFPINAVSGVSTSRDVLWTVSVSSQAISRNSHFPLLTLGYTGAGPMTDMCFYEIAAKETAAIVSGSSIESVPVAKGIEVDHLTPLEPKFATEVADAVTGMRRSEANEIVNKLLDKYEDNLDNPPKGKRYQDCFDVESMQPSEEYSDLYVDVKEKIKELGLPLD